jgi:hypothetical protein
MPRKNIARKKAAYPRETAGSRMAAKLRKQANSFTDAQRERHFEAGMAMIYGGQHSKQTARARH